VFYVIQSAVLGSDNKVWLTIFVEIY